MQIPILILLTVLSGCNLKTDLKVAEDQAVQTGEKIVIDAGTDLVKGVNPVSDIEKDAIQGGVALAEKEIAVPSTNA